MVPSPKTRSSRLLPGGSVGRLGYSPTWPPRNTPLAITTLCITVRVPDTPEVTMVPLNVSLPLLAAAAGHRRHRAHADRDPGGQQYRYYLSFYASPLVR
jgi:hypothetical protein